MKKLFVLIAVVCLMISTQAFATTFITGDPELTGYNTGTTGSSAAPWTIAESLTGPLTLQFTSDTGGSALGSNMTGTGHYYGKWFEKTITNDSGIAWTSFELELQSVFGTPSVDGDGLSFAQGGGLLFSSNRFSEYTRVDTTRDYLNFHGGTVAAGETVTIAFAVTDNQTRSSFWLLETPNKREVTVPEPLSLTLLGFGIVGVAGMKKYLKK